MIRRNQKEKQPETQTALLMQVKTHGGEKKAKEKLEGPMDEVKPEAKNSLKGKQATQRADMRRVCTKLELTVIQRTAKKNKWRSESIYNVQKT